MLEVKEVQESSISENKSADNDELRFDDIVKKTKNPKLLKET